MASNNTMCTFHPDKKASSACTRCFRPICAADTRDYSYIKGTGYFNAFGLPQNEEVDEDYCPICFVIINKQRLLKGFGVILIVIVCAVVTPVMGFSKLIMYGAELFWIFILVVSIIGIIKWKIKISEYEKEAKILIQSIRDANSSKNLI